MSRINRNNYEAWFLDYIEGNLPSDMAGEFHEFLLLNPDLAEDLELAVEPVLSPDFPAPDFSHLKVEISEEQLVSIVEGDLDDKTREDFLSLIKDSPAEKELELLRKTILIPDSTVEFPFKNELKKEGGKIRTLFYAVTSAAAIFLLMLSIYNNTEIYSPRNGVFLSDNNALIPEKTPTSFVESFTVLTPEKKEKHFHKTNNQSAANQPFHSVELNSVEIAMIPVKEAMPAENENLNRELLIPPTIETDTEMLASSYDVSVREEYYETPVSIIRSIAGRKEKVEETPADKYDALAFVLAGYTKITRQETSLKTSIDGSNTFSLAAGNFEFSRTKGNKK